MAAKGEVSGPWWRAIIMIPVMFGGMLSGMCIAMAEAMRGLAVGAAAGWGALIGLFGLVITSIANARLRANA